MNSRRSKIALVLVAALAWAAPLHAQQQEGPSVGDVVNGVRGFFGRIFGSEPKSAASEAPAAAAAPVPATAPAAAPAQPATMAIPTAQVVARSLHAAVVGGDLDETLKLLDSGANIEVKDPGSGASPLHYAVMKGRMQMIDLLLSRGADVNSRTKNGTTPLHTAALYARIEVAERLLAAHADINARSLSGATPLALATAAKNWPLADLLREHGAK